MLDAVGEEEAEPLAAAEPLLLGDAAAVADCSGEGEADAVLPSDCDREGEREALLLDAALGEASAVGEKEDADEGVEEVTALVLGAPLALPLDDGVAERVSDTEAEVALLSERLPLNEGETADVTV